MCKFVSLKNSVALSLAALILGLAVSTPVEAGQRRMTSSPHPSFHGGGGGGSRPAVGHGFHGGQRIAVGFHGGERLAGGHRFHGGLGWGPGLGIGLVGSAVAADVAATSCTGYRRIYDEYGNYLGQQAVNVCQ
jgi:hypothetical protein